MKLAQIVVGLAFLMLAAVCPLPPVLAIPGTAWRMIIGLLSCAAVLSGVSGLVKRGEKG